MIRPTDAQMKSWNGTTSYSPVATMATRVAIAPTIPRSAHSIRCAVAGAPSFILFGYPSH
jgi:hypothetical protein